MEVDLNRIKSFRNFIEYEKIIKFFAMIFEEFKVNFKKDLKVKKFDLIFIYNILNLVIKNFVVKVLVNILYKI